MRHNGAREPIYRHDSVFWGIETFYRSKFSPATGVKICVRSRNTQPHLKPNKVAKGIFQPKLQKRWPQLCRVLRRSLFTTKFVQFSRIIVVIRCWIFSWMTLTCNVSKILRDESKFRTCSWTCSVPGTMNIIKIIWTPWLWPRELKKSEIFCFSKWRYERQGALETDLPNCCVSITCQSLSMLWRSAREHCNSADGARHAHKFYFSVRISYKFPISDCTGDSYLGLCRSWHLAYRMLQRSGRICFQQANGRNSEPIWALHSCIILTGVKRQYFSRCKELHRRQACSPLQIDTGNLCDIHTEKYLPIAQRLLSWHLKVRSADRDSHWNWVKKSIRSRLNRD